MRASSTSLIYTPMIIYHSQEGSILCRQNLNENIEPPSPSLYAILSSKTNALLLSNCIKFVKVFESDIKQPIAPWSSCNAVRGSWY